MADTIWLNVAPASAESLARIAKTFFSEMNIEVVVHGNVGWIKVSGNGQVDDLRSFLKGIKSVQ